MLSEASQLVSLLPYELVGTCILEAKGELFRGDAAALKEYLEKGKLLFHYGSIRGAFPSFPNS